MNMLHAITNPSLIANLLNRLIDFLKCLLIYISLGLIPNASKSFFLLIAWAKMLLKHFNYLFTMDANCSTSIYKSGKDN